MYNTKYKDRSPQETIDIVKNFFYERGINIKEVPQFESEINTWTAQVVAVIDNQQIYSANGKGMNLLFAKASAYAELYERFCNSFEYYMNPFYTNQILEYRKKNKGYYFDKSEKIIDINDEGLKEMRKSLITNAFFNNQIIRQDYLVKYLKILLNNHFIFIPFNNFINKEETKDFDIRLCWLQTTSTGMAAGNTLNEALVQGMSEICERRAYNLLLKLPQFKYYELNIEKLDIPKELKEKIRILQSHSNYNVKFFDLSYNFSMPVILSVLIDKINHRIIPNLGSSPIFSIALERSVTELYQGIYSYEFNNGKNPYTRLQKPFLQQYYYDIRYKFSSSSYGLPSIFNENIIKQENIILTDSPSEIWCSNLQANNKELKEYYNNLLQKLNMQCYYRDVSKTDDMFAVYIFCDSHFIWEAQIDGMKSNINWQRNLNYYFDYYNWSLKILNQSNNLIISPPEIHFGNKDYDHGYCCNILNWSCFVTPEIYKDIGIFGYSSIINHFIKEEDNLKALNDIVSNHNILLICPLVRKYATILNYLRIYNSKETYKLLNDMGFNVTEEEVLNSNNKLYLYNKIFVETFKNSYNSLTYKKLVSALC